jgi:hypothetical protein
MRLKHALHNEAACDYLFADARFSDWVITAAFYSALHFVHHELFPGTYDGAHHAGFDAYCFYLSRKKKVKRSKIISKHAVTLQLVRQHSGFYPQYHWLYSHCMTVRYTNYNVPRNQAVYAQKQLGFIKSSLSKPLTNK